MSSLLDWLWTFIVEVATPSCIVSGLIIACGVVYAYDRSYAAEQYATAQKVDDVAAVAKANRISILKQEIARSHERWCNASDPKDKQFFWDELQEGQEEYVDKKGAGSRYYPTGECQV